MTDAASSRPRDAEPCGPRLSPAELRELCQRGNLRPVAVTLAVGATIVAANALFVCWPSAASLAFCLLFVAAMQHHLLILQHEAVHRLMSTNPRWNDFLGRLVGYPIGLPLAYRRHHMHHHAHLGLAGDPDRWAYEHHPLPRGALLLDVLGTLTGVVAVRQFWRQVVVGRPPVPGTGAAADAGAGPTARAGGGGDVPGGAAGHPGRAAGAGRTVCLAGAVVDVSGGMADPAADADQDAQPRPHARGACAAAHGRDARVVAATDDPLRPLGTTVPRPAALQLPRRASPLSRHPLPSAAARPSPAGLAAGVSGGRRGAVGLPGDALECRPIPLRQRCSGGAPLTAFGVKGAIWCIDTVSITDDWPVTERGDT